MDKKEDQAGGHDLGVLGDIVLQKGAPGFGERSVTLSEMFNLLCQGSTKYIRREHPGIRPDTIALGRAWLIAARPDLYTCAIAPGHTGDLRMLVDENLPAKIIPIIRNGFGYATHTNFIRQIHSVELKGCGNSGRGDRPVWEWAVNNGIDAIVSIDRGERDPKMDLTRIAKDHALEIMKRMAEEGREIVDLSDLPVLIQVTSARKDYRYVSGIINKNRTEIYSYLQTRTSPVIVVNEQGVRPDKTYLSLWKKYLQDMDIAKNGYPNIPRRERRIEQWWNAIAKNNPNITPERRAEIEKMLRNAAELYTRSEPRESSFIGKIGVRRTSSRLP